MGGGRLLTIALAAGFFFSHVPIVVQVCQNTRMTFVNNLTGVELKEYTEAVERHWEKLKDCAFMSTALTILMIMIAALFKLDIIEAAATSMIWFFSAPVFLYFVYIDEDIRIVPRQQREGDANQQRDARESARLKMRLGHNLYWCMVRHALLWFLFSMLFVYGVTYAILKYNQRVRALASSPR
jgi:hypothetical protein